MNECSILWCGKYHQNWENELHCHNYFQMVGILSGSGTVYVDDQPYEIEKEQVFLLCPQQLHAIHCGEKNAAPLKMLDVKFTVADPALFEDLVRVGDMFHLQDFGWFVRFFDKIIAESAQQRPIITPSSAAICWKCWYVSCGNGWASPPQRPRRRRPASPRSRVWTLPH